MGIPDVLGFLLDDAVPLLRNAGYHVSEVISKPPKGNPEGLKRVVRVQPAGPQEVVITVVCEEKGKGGVLNGL